MPDIKFSNQYPYTDFHELNLDWVIKEVKYWSTKVGKTIQSIELTESSGLVDTYTIIYSDGTTSTFDVTNGNGIASVAKTGTAGLVDTYTITFQDGSTTTFEVRNGTASIDPTLSLSDYAADAKATGDLIFDIVSVHTNILENQSFNDNKYWVRHAPLQTSSATGYQAFNGINVESGKTYYFKHIFLYYSVVVYEGTTTPVPLSDITSQDMSGTFVPADNGVLYLTANKIFTPMFTDDELMYDSPSEETFYTPNKLRIPQDESTVDLITAYGTTDGNYLDNSGQPSTSPDYRVSNYIPVNSNNIYSIAFYGQLFIAFYDADKTFISRPVYNSAGERIKSKIHLPNTASFVRLSNAIVYNEYTKFAEEIPGAEFHVGPTFPYTKISDAINDAITFIDSVVKIHNGTYDLYNELGGSAYFDSYVASVNGNGLILSNNIRVIGSSNSVITFNYPDNNTQVKQYFSVFNSGVAGFTLENVTIVCSNCRYAIHDERYTSTDMYKNNYLNCDITIDNSANPYGYVQCIGGGLGKHGEIIIENCHFNTVNPTTPECVSYHNTSASNAKSRIIVSGNYCEGGTMRFSWYGSSTLISDIIASNNSLPAAIITRAENSSALIVNIALTEWNNVVR